MRRVFEADALIDVPLPGVGIVPTPCERRAGGRLLLFPMPKVADKPVALGTEDVTLLGASWFVNDAVAGTLPATCHSQETARVLADMWLAAVLNESIDPANADQTQSWCWWYASSHKGDVDYTPMYDRPVVQLAAPARAMPMLDNVVPEAPGEENA